MATSEEEASSMPLLKDIDNNELSKKTSGNKTEKLPLLTKICFAFGGMPYSTTNTAINFFISVFLLEVAQIQPYQLSIVLLVGKVWDAITDPICGYLISRRDSKLGKLKPWIIFSMPFGCGMYFLLWYVPDIPDDARVAWYLLSYCLFQTCLTCLHVPYTSLTMYLSADQKERDNATAFRMAFEIVGTLFATTVQGQIINVARNGVSECSGEIGATLPPSVVNKQKQAYMISTGIICGLYLFCVLVVFFGVKEREGVIHEQPEPFFKAFKMVFSHGPYVKLTFAFLFISLAIATTQGNLILFVTHSLHIGDEFANLIIILLGSSIVCIPLWQFILTKIGKKKTFATGMILMIPCLFSCLYIPAKEDGGVVVDVLMYGVVVIAGGSIAVSFLLPWSMLPDVLDEFMLKTGNRHDTIFYSFYVFFNKMASGLSLAASQIALQIGGYVSGACTQPPSVGLTLRMLIAPVPIVCILIALLFLAWYPITEERRALTRQSLEEARNKFMEKSNIHGQSEESSGV